MNTMLIHADAPILSEFSKDLDSASLTYEERSLVANSADAGFYDVLSVALGSALTLLAQAIISYLSRHKGQRKISIQFLDGDHLKNVEIETPNINEVEILLKKARSVFIYESFNDKSKKKKTPESGPRD